MVSARRDSGFTYIGLLIAVAVIGIGLAGAGTIAATTAKRERERELLFIGDQFRRAIASYYETSPGTPRYPQSLEELLEDRRFATPRRHLRKLYVDPMIGNNDWGIVRGPGEAILGIHSRSNERPLQQANFPLRYEQFNGAARYADWQFLHRPLTAPAGSR